MTTRQLKPYQATASSPLGQLSHELAKLVEDVDDKNKRIEALKKRIKALTAEAMGTEADIELVVEGLEKNLRVVEEARSVFDLVEATLAHPGLDATYRKTTYTRKLVWVQR